MTFEILGMPHITIWERHNCIRIHETIYNNLQFKTYSAISENLYTLSLNQRLLKLNRQRKQKLSVVIYLYVFSVCVCLYD